MAEKPLATSIAESKAMIEAAKGSGAFLMTAYRLHDETGHAMLQCLRSGGIGQPIYVGSTFSFQAGQGNHRLWAAHWGGPLPDVGIYCLYCLNASRHIFEAEPVAVQAIANRPLDDPRFTEIDASLAVTLTFPGNRLAQFFCSFGAALSETIRVIGEEGELLLDPAFRFESAMKLHILKASDERVRTLPHVDHFAGQIAHFSDCIRQGLPPEAGGEEGLADMRVLLAIEEAARIGNVVTLEPLECRRTITPQMSRSFPVTERRLLV